MRRWLLSMLMILLITPAIAETPLAEISIHFFDAGKADAFLLKTPDSTVLIDTGKNKMGKEIVSYLEDHGIETIDVLFITHFDKDHVGGADKVLESVSVGTVYEPAYVSDSKQYQQYREMISELQVPLVTLSQNMSFELDGVIYDIDVANQSYYGEDEENDFSLVISIRYGETSFLFAGDAENPRLAELLAEGIGHYDVLKVPHHGKSEKWSAAFFEAVSPRYAVITSDEEEPEETGVVHALKQYGEVFLTRFGPVTCMSDGRSIRMTQ